MQVIKIDIKKEITDVKQGALYIKYAVIPQLRAMAEEGKNISDMVTCNEETYFINKVHNPETKENICYAVKQDDEKMFRDLIVISNSYIENKILEGINNFKEDFIHFDIPRIEENTYIVAKNRIKKLSFWKRLRNDF